MAKRGHFEGPQAHFTSMGLLKTTKNGSFWGPQAHFTSMGLLNDPIFRVFRSPIEVKWPKIGPKYPFSNQFYQFRGFWPRAETGCLAGNYLMDQAKSTLSLTFFDHFLLSKLQNPRIWPDFGFRFFPRARHPSKHVSGPGFGSRPILLLWDS